MNKKKKNIFKDKKNRLNFLKNEFKKIIYKSIKKNAAKPVIKTILFNFLYSNNKKINSISRQYNICLLQGRIGGVYKQFQICRHAMLKLGTEGTLQNTKISSW